MAGIPQSVLDALNQALSDVSAMTTADTAVVDAQNALAAAQAGAATADKAATDSKLAAIKAVTDLLNAPAS